MITFAEHCPLTKQRHSFTLSYDDVLHAKKLEFIAVTIRYSNAAEPGICASRSRALMEAIYKVIEWEKGLVTKHPLLPNAGTYRDVKKELKADEVN